MLLSLSAILASPSFMIALLLSLLAISGLLVLCDCSSNTFGVKLFGRGEAHKPRTDYQKHGLCKGLPLPSKPNRDTPITRQNPPLLIATVVNPTNQIKKPEGFELLL